jgi:hypothetical protein
MKQDFIIRYGPERKYSIQEMKQATITSKELIEYYFALHLVSKR